MGAGAEGTGTGANTGPSADEIMSAIMQNATAGNGAATATAVNAEGTGSQSYFIS